MTKKQDSKFLLLLQFIQAFRVKNSNMKSTVLHNNSNDTQWIFDYKQKRVSHKMVNDDPVFVLAVSSKIAFLFRSA